MTDRPTIPVTVRAEELVNGHRRADYGDPHENFARIADLWTPLLGTKVTPVQVALCMTALKMARITHTPDHEDSWVDAIGYLSLGELLTRPVPENNLNAGGYSASAELGMGGY